MKHSSFNVIIFMLSMIFLLNGCKDDDPGINKSNKVHYIQECDIRNSAYITLPVTIEKQKFNFILDTGADSIVVDERLRHYFGKTVKENVHTFTLDDIDLEMETVEPAKSFFIGNEISYIDTVDVCDLSKFGLDECYDGIIGMDLLGHFSLLLDFENNRIELATDPNALKVGSFTSHMKLLPDTGYDDNGQLVLTDKGTPQGMKPFIAMPNGISESFLIDTGMNGGNTFSESLFDAISNHSPYSVVSVTLGTIHGLEEGKAILVTSPIWGNSQLSFIRSKNSILGMPFLKQYSRVLFDFRRGEMLLCLPSVSGETDEKRELENDSTALQEK